MRKAVAIDANLLILLIVGMTSRKYVARHKRCKIFEPDDFDLLVHLLSAAEVILTPNTLTEASNLLRQIDEPARTEIGLVFKAYIRRAQERYVESTRATTRTEFIRLGLTDAALLQLEDVVILTTDLDLYVAACRDKRPAVNFFHLKEARS
jgi:hypothetical protein